MVARGKAVVATAIAGAVAMVATGIVAVASAIAKAIAVVATAAAAAVGTRLAPTAMAMVRSSSP